MEQYEVYKKEMESFRNICKKLFSECGTGAEVDAMHMLLEDEIRIAKAGRMDRLPDADNRYLRAGR